MWKNHFDALKHIINYQFLCGKTLICVKTHNLLNEISHNLNFLKYLIFFIKLLKFCNKILNTQIKRFYT